MKKVIVLFSIFMGNCLLAVPAQESVYEYLTKVFLQSCEAKKDTSSIVAGSLEQEKKLELKVRSIGEMQQRVLFAHMLQQMCGAESLSTIISTDGIQQLDIANAGNGSTLAARLAPQTLLGEVLLTKMLCLPLTDTKNIIQRQRLIQELVTHPEVMARLTSALGKIQRGQELFFSFFDKENQLKNEVLQQVYIPWVGPANKSLYALYGWRGFMNFMIAVYFIPFEFFKTTPLVFMQEYWRQPQGVMAKTWRYGAVAPARSLWLAFKMLAQRHNVFVKYTDEQIQQKVQSILDCNKNSIDQVIEAAIHDVTLPIRNWHDQSEVAHVASLECEVYNLVRPIVIIPLLKAHNKIFYNMQTRLIGAADIVRGLREVDAVLRDCPQIINLLPQLKQVQDLFAGSYGREVNSLLKLLDTRTFTGESSFFSNGPRILCAYKLMDAHKGDFAPVLEAAGMLDAFTAVAREIKNAGQGRYCFANLSDSVLPSVQLTNFWNPLLPANTAVLNSVCLGSLGDRNMLLTGPNGSGKSTNMKGVVLNVLLAQTFGVAAAEKAVITPFDRFNVYINVKENLQEGKSTFMAEADRLRMICQSVEALKPGQRGLSVVDEGLRGTVAEEAAVRLRQAIEIIIGVPQNICMFATHLQEPTTIETAMAGAITNYFVELQEPTLGLFVRTFKLQRGVNQWWFTDVDRRKRFVDWLVAQTK